MNLGSIIGLSSIGAVMLVVGMWMWFHREFPRTTVFFFLCGGTVIGGFAGAALGRGIDTALLAAATTSNRLLGIGVASVIAGLAIVLTLEVIWKGMSPFKKLKAKTKRYHAWLALALPTVVVATGLPVVVSAVRLITSVTGA